MGLLAQLIALFPAGQYLPESLHTAMSTIGGYLNLLTPIVPFNTLFTALMIVIGLEIALFNWKSIKWLLSHIPFIGGKGNN